MTWDLAEAQEAAYLEDHGYDVVCAECGHTFLTDAVDLTDVDCEECGESDVGVA